MKLQWYLANCTGIMANGNSMPLEVVIRAALLPCARIMELMRNNTQTRLKENMIIRRTMPLALSFGPQKSSTAREIAVCMGT